MWSCRALSVATACVVSGLLLNLKFFKDGIGKVSIFSVTKLLIFSCLLCLPFVTDFPILLLGKGSYAQAQWLS